MSEELKTCNKCAHVVGVRDHWEMWEKWKCGHPNNIKEEGINLVSGQAYRIYKVEFCKDARTSLPSCNHTGAWFEEYKEPVPTEITAKVGSKTYDL